MGGMKGKPRQPRSAELPGREREVLADANANQAVYLRLLKEALDDPDGFLRRDETGLAAEIKKEIAEGRLVVAPEANDGGDQLRAAMRVVARFRGGVDVHPVIITEHGVIDAHSSIEQVDREYYSKEIMGNAAAKAAAARTFSDRELQEYIQWGEVAAAILRERENKDRAAAEPRPVQLDDAATETTTSKPSAGLTWPTAKWIGSSEKILGKKRGILTFLKREWEPFIQHSGQVVTRDILAMHDGDAEAAFTRYLETHDFPDGISIVYPKQLMKLVGNRPDLVRAAFGDRQIADLHK
jgi:hypothetical protein